jgi:hypothetical protein
MAVIANLESSLYPMDCEVNVEWPRALLARVAHFTASEKRGPIELYTFHFAKWLIVKCPFGRRWGSQQKDIYPISSIDWRIALFKFVAILAINFFDYYLCMYRFLYAVGKIQGQSPSFRRSRRQL